MTTPLYDAICALEQKIGDLPRHAEHLERYGLTVTGKIPALRERAEALLDDPQYQGNAVVQRMRAGERLQDIVDETVKLRRYSLKLPGKGRERAEYNRRIDQLALISYRAGSLKRGSIFSPMEPEGFALFMVTMSTGLFWGSIYVLPDIQKTMTRYGSAKIGVVIGVAFGILNALIEPAKVREAKNRLKEQATYIDNVLGRTER